MNSLILYLFYISSFSFSCKSQFHDSTNAVVFSHNDYAQISPFTNAYHHRVGYIEADIYLRNDSLFIAHEPDEIDPVKTLQNSYLDSLSAKIKFNGGTVYPEPSKSLVLMIDLKTNGELTIPVLVQALISYPNLIASGNNLKIVLSGSMPLPSIWDTYPDYIWFDGRPTVEYDTNALKRIALVSTNFKNYSNWDGSDSIPNHEDERILALIDRVHAIKKPLRFWATPDTENTWAYLRKRKVDILGTDKVSELCAWLALTK